MYENKKNQLRSRIGPEAQLTTGGHISQDIPHFWPAMQEYERTRGVYEFCNFIEYDLSYNTEPLLKQDTHHSMKVKRI